jgi:hypothetical protein
LIAKNLSFISTDTAAYSGPSEQSTKDDEKRNEEVEEEEEEEEELSETELKRVQLDIINGPASSRDQDAYEGEANKEVDEEEEEEEAMENGEEMHMKNMHSEEGALQFEDPSSGLGKNYAVTGI